MTRGLEQHLSTLRRTLGTTSLTLALAAMVMAVAWVVVQAIPSPGQWLAEGYQRGVLDGTPDEVSRIRR